MNAIYDKVEEITIDEKQAHQVKTLIKLSFVIGMAFQKNIPDITPESDTFNSAYELYLVAIGKETVKMFDGEMKDYETGQPTELL